MRSKFFNRSVSALLAFLLVFELIPAWVYADDQDPSEAEALYAEEQETLADEEADFEDDIIVEEFARNTASSEKAVIAEELREAGMNTRKSSSWKAA